MLEIGVTAIEVGIPFTDPVADGPTIEKACERALANGTNLRNVLATLKSFANEVTIPLVAMTYLNPILAYGAAAFARDAREAGIRGLIVPDMPLEESGIIHDELRAEGITLPVVGSTDGHTVLFKYFASSSTCSLHTKKVDWIN